MEIMRMRNSEGSAGGEPGGSHVSNVLLGQPATTRLFFVGVKKSVKSPRRKLITYCLLE